VQLSVGSRWTDSQGQQFKIDAVDDNNTETWVAYTRVSDGTNYRCLAEAFTCRFLRIENDSRT
jgi:hypothetical protein